MLRGFQAIFRIERKQPFLLFSLYVYICHQSIRCWPFSWGTFFAARPIFAAHSNQETFINLQPNSICTFTQFSTRIRILCASLILSTSTSCSDMHLNIERLRCWNRCNIHIEGDSHIDACHAHTFNQFANVYVSIVCRDKPHYCLQRRSCLGSTQLFRRHFSIEIGRKSVPIRFR